MKNPACRMFRHRKHRRGQGMVEFAIVLPLLVLLLVMAIDFGRVFFGWVALQNAARIGADRAAQTWRAWPTADNAEEILWESQYQALITSDLQAANCNFTTPHPDPTFTNVDANPTIDYGDLATVRLDCSFDLITPLAEGLFGGPLMLSAESTFAVNGIVVMGVPDPPPPADPCSTPNASFDTDPARTTGGRVNDSNILAGSIANPYRVDFTATATSTEFCAITYEWKVDGTAIGTTREILDHPFTDPAGGSHTDYLVELTVTNASGETATDNVTVRVRNP